MYMNPRRERNTLYYEEYNTVSVMFASLTEYTLGVDDDNEEHELVMLGVLNSIICDFDRVSISDIFLISIQDKTQWVTF